MVNILSPKYYFLLFKKLFTLRGKHQDIQHLISFVKFTRKYV
jgi:hypothetical protein